MNSNYIGEIVLAKLKDSSKYARKEEKSDKYKEYYKLGFIGEKLFLIEEESSGEEASIQPISKYDISYIYCLDNGEVRHPSVDEFFKFYWDYIKLFIDKMEAN